MTNRSLYRQKDIVLTYGGFEQALDIDCDVVDCLPDGEWEGTLTITVSYKPYEDTN